jgi:hypothetical protein
MPTGDGSYRLVHEFIEPDQKGRTKVEMRRFPQIYKPRGVAHIAVEFLRSGGFLKQSARGTPFHPPPIQGASP